MSLGHGANIVRDGLVFHLDAASVKSYPGSGTTWSDVSGNSNDGTLTNGPVFSSDNQGSFIFDGNNDYLELDPTVIPQGGSLTFELFSKVGVVKYSSVIEAKNSVGGRTLNIHLPWITSIVYFDCGGEAGSTTYDRLIYSIDYMTELEKTSWHHWAFVKDFNDPTGGRMTIYLDGDSVATSGGRLIVPDATTNARIASYAYGGNNYSGEISQVKIYNRALSAAEIQQNFNALRGRYGI